MTYLEKYYTKRLIDSFKSQTEINQFNMYFDLRGSFKYARFTEGLAKKKAILLFLRIYKYRFKNYIGSNGIYKYDLGKI